MQIGLGSLTLRTLNRFSGTSENAGLVTLNSGGGTLITSLDCGTVFDGDMLLMNAHLVISNIAVSGDATYSFGKSSGSATIVFAHNQAVGTSYLSPGGVNGIPLLISAMFEVTVTGTLVFGLSGITRIGGSTLDIAIGAGQLRILNLAGTVAVGA